MTTERAAPQAGQASASADMELLLRRVERERQARKQAEQLLEHKSRELYEANQQLQAQTAKLELTVLERTRALEEALAAMQDALRAKGEFLAVVSHEIRTPMNGVLGMAELLRLTDLTDEQRRYVSTIQTSGETLLAIINDILDMSKLDSGKVRLDARPLEPRVVLREVADLLGAQAQSKGLYLDVDVARDVPKWIAGDATRLKQIVTNLVGNALKFTHHGGVRVSLALVEAGAILECQVQDTGIGIPPDKVGRLFERFSQVDSSINRRYGGTGLGLVICKHLVEAMGGVISAQSKQHRGSTFTFRIPFTPAEPPAAAPAPASDAPAAACGLRILLVEDNPVNQMLAMGMLQKLGCTADLARDGEEALGMVRAVDYDLVLMDMQMPRMDGLTATRAIRGMSLRAQPQIVALTANAMESDRDLCLAAGMNDFLAKPFKVGELEGKVAAAVARRAAAAGKAEAG
jgi:signal transduction histidine kinase/ActR/RegA family two-component response regulator